MGQLDPYILEEREIRTYNLRVLTTCPKFHKHQVNDINPKTNYELVSKFCKSSSSSLMGWSSYEKKDGLVLLPDFLLIRSINQLYFIYVEESTKYNLKLFYYILCATMNFMLQKLTSLEYYLY